jgi:hypothetical protein
VDQEIELAEPRFIPLAQEEAAEAAHLLAALIRAVPARSPDSPIPPPEGISSLGDVAGGSPVAPGDGGKARSADAAGGGR